MFFPSILYLYYPLTLKYLMVVICIKSGLWRMREVIFFLREFPQGKAPLKLLRWINAFHRNCCQSVVNNFENYFSNN